MSKENNLQVLHVVHHDTFSASIDYDTFLFSLKNIFSQTLESITPGVILYIEFYGFNHFYGAGINMYERDKILIDKIGRKLICLLDEDDIVARVGDYRYVIIRKDVSHTAYQELAQQIIYAFSEPCMVNGQMFYVYTSIGIALYPFEGEDIYKLVKIAEAKMEQAKQNGRNLIGMVQRTTGFLDRRETELKKALPAALENGEIMFVYQAQYSHHSGSFTGAEVLARWNHPVYGEIPPNVFIPLAEQSGMIASLSVHAIIAASKAFSAFEKEKIENFSLSVNISPLFLVTNHFYQTLEFLVKEYALGRGRLHFEITEEIFLRHTDYLMDILCKIKELGILIELDDFGTGYTSVKQLADLPLDIVKVDQSFIRGIDKEEKKRDFLGAIVEMTKVLGIDVLVEGVENTAEDMVIRALSPMTVQGYLYARPEPLEILMKKLKKNNYERNHTV